MKSTTILALSLAGAIAAGCASMMMESDKSAEALAVLKASFRENGQAKLDRLDQDDEQKTCSQYTATNPGPKDVAEKIDRPQLAPIKYPQGSPMADWKLGERTPHT